MKQLLFVAALLCTTAAIAEEAPSPYQNLMTPLVTGGSDILGSALAYPAAPLNITSAIVTIPAGGETGWHLHDVPVFAYILEGELTVNYGTKGTKTYHTGESVLEAVNWPHDGTNTGTVPVKVLTVYMGGGGKPNTVMQPAP